MSLKFEATISHSSSCAQCKHYAIYVIEVKETDDYSVKSSIFLYPRKGNTKNIILTCYKDKVMFDWNKTFVPNYTKNFNYGYYYDSYPKCAEILSTIGQLGGKLL